MIDINLVQTTEKETLIIQSSEKETILIESVSGPSGSSFLSGTTAPLSTQGANFDTYLDISLGFLYKKLNDAWIFQGAVATPNTDSKFVTEVYVLNSSDILNKYITLEAIPVSVSKTTVEIQNGPTQAYGIDFTVISNKISWDSLAFELLFEVGIIIIVRYYKD